MLYCLSVAVETDDPQSVKECLCHELEELGFVLGLGMVDVKPLEIQMDFDKLAVERVRRQFKADELLKPAKI